MKKYIKYISFIALLFILSCSSSKPPALNPDQLSPYQKRADIVIENDDYSKTNSDINKLAKTYDGYVKNAAMGFDLQKNAYSEFELQIPYKYFYDFTNAFHQRFKADIKEENITTEVSKARLYAANAADIDEKTKEQSELTKLLANSKDVNDRIVIKAQLDRLDGELNEMNHKRLDFLESLNFSTVKVIWKNSSNKNEFRDSLIPPIAGLEPFPPPIKEILFTEYGQERSFQIGEPVKILFSGLDPDKTDVITKTDFEDNTITMRVVEKGFREIVSLEKKCQIIDVGLGPIPQIKASPSLAREQIIVTPRLNDECVMTGYEIRAGTIQSGCIKGRQNLNRLRKCDKIIILPPTTKDSELRSSRLPMGIFKKVVDLEK
ncbi:MAG: DUF4349 domain-containing protein [FCB group bacterium]|jgi:hypothetical protein